ncbi:MAG: hypothetical protein WAO20_22245 [Acidobacteriota bacterium]
MRSSWKLQGDAAGSNEGYWASYSDLMAGILLVFAVAAATSWIEFHQSLIKPTEPLRRWERFLVAILNDQDLKNNPAVRVDPRTGSLIIAEESLRYPRSETDLSEEGKKVLDRIIPKYLEIVTRHLTENFSGSDQGDGIIEGIEISGHTDSSGDYGSNSWVSRERAGKVLLYLIDSPAMKAYRDLLQRKGYAVGYADSRPPPGERRGLVDDPQARRIEILVRVNHSRILDEIRKLLGGQRAILRPARR